MGGGRQCLISNSTGSDLDPIDTWACFSTDGRNLLKQWQNDKQIRGLKHSIVQNNEELQQLDLNSEYVLGKYYKPQF